MLSLLVDGQAHDSTVFEGDGLVNAIGSLSSEVAKNGRFIASLKVNGEECEVGSDCFANRVMADVSCLEVTTGSTEQLALEALADGSNYLEELRTVLLQTAELYRTGRETEGREFFMELIQGLEWFVKIASTAEVLLKVDFTATVHAGRTLTKSVDNLNSILLEIITAQEQRDWVLLTDLLEYELAPQLELWREIFGTLRQRDRHAFA